MNDHPMLVAEPTGVDRVTQVLKGQIRSGALAPGQRLLPRRELCDHFGVSATVIHAAYDRLEAEGLIHRKAGSGVLVAESVRPPKTRLIGVLTDYARDFVESYFEPLMEAAAEKGVIIMPVSLAFPPAGRTWKSLTEDLLAQGPDALLVDVDGPNRPLDEWHALIGDTPVCYVNRWTWQGVEPERAVLTQYAGILSGSLERLQARGHERILVLTHAQRNLPGLRRDLELICRRAGLAFDEVFAVLAGDEMHSDPAAAVTKVRTLRPQAVLGEGDYLVAALEALCPETARLDRIGCYNTWHSRRPGRAFSTYAIDMKSLWLRAIDSFERAPEVVRTPPQFIARWPGEFE
jgi:GntR family transcriptional regulator